MPRFQSVASLALLLTLSSASSLASSGFATEYRPPNLTFDFVSVIPDEQTGDVQPLDERLNTVGCGHIIPEGDEPPVADHWWLAPSVVTSWSLYRDPSSDAGAQLDGLDGNSFEVGLFGGYLWGDVGGVFTAVAARATWNIVSGHFTGGTSQTRSAIGMVLAPEIGWQFGGDPNDPLRLGQAIQLFVTARFDFTGKDFFVPQSNTPLMSSDGKWAYALGFGIRILPCGQSQTLSVTAPPTFAIYFDAFGSRTPRNLIISVDVLGLANLLLFGLSPIFS